MTDFEAELRKTIQEKRAVLVAGTGVSIASSRDPKTGKPHPQASWAGLLESGLEWLEKRGLMTSKRAEGHRALLAEEAETHHFISAAQDVTEGFGGQASSHFEEWLKRTIGSIQAHDRTLLDAFEDLRRHGNLLATTNYDGLLLGDSGVLSALTWEENHRAEFLRAVRNRDTDKVLFLHGFWRRPSSVILDWNSYQAISSEEQYRDDLRAFWQTSTWIFVGCGVDGLRDPDLGLLLERYGARHRKFELWDFCLVRASQREAFQAEFDKRQLSIRAVSFGADFDDLPNYLRSLLPTPISLSSPPLATARSSRRPATIPLPPAFHAEPDYIGSHGFVGRVSQLEDLDDWAKAADPANLLLFEAIGGNGKSMLTWEWARNRSTEVRDDWAGRFWYSFYERGAVMADFCRRALVYMTGEALEELAKERTPELARRLLAELHARPWLLVLDGLERVLVAYHRIDAAEVPDEEANTPTDKVLRRDPCDTIRDEDGDLLRQLAGARPSKILMTSRLTPRVLINAAGQGIEGVKRFPLPGLRPADAEALLRSCGIEGDSAAIQAYLSENCDNHPLVIGVLAGLITNYLPRRGNFDAWAADAGPLGGARLNLAELDLIQRRNHILHAALAALPAKSRELLSTLALLSGSVDYDTLAAFNPHLPAEPEEVAVPEKPEEGWDWEWMSEEEKSRVREEYEVALGRRREYEQALAAWQASAEVRAAPGRLGETVKELEQRGLLLFDRTAQRYDLHPVVRGVAGGGLQGEERERLGQRVVDHFSSVPHGPWDQARTREDLAPGLHVVRTLVKLGRWEEAGEAYRGDLSTSLLSALEDHSEVLALLRPFFPEGWSELPRELAPDLASYLANDTAVSLGESGDEDSAAALLGRALQADLARDSFIAATLRLSNLWFSLVARNQLARASRLTSMTLQLAEALDDEEQLFRSLLGLFHEQARAGQWAADDETWRRLDPMGRSWRRAIYRQGYAEELFALSQLWRGQLREEHLVTATALAEKDNNRKTLRTLHWLRGAWKLEQGEWEAAAVAFHEAVTMARERRLLDAPSEAGLALAKLHLGRLGTPEEARQEVERLAGGREPFHRYLALLWRELGDLAEAADQALAAYRRAWADGEPHVWRFELTQATELLRELNVPIPELPSYDPAQDEPFPWEADVRAAISRLEAEKAQKKAKAGK